MYVVEYCPRLTARHLQDTRRVVRPLSFWVACEKFPLRHARLLHEARASPEPVPMYEVWPSFHSPRNSSLAGDSSVEYLPPIQCTDTNILTNCSTVNGQYLQVNVQVAVPYCQHCMRSHFQLPSNHRLPGDRRLRLKTGSSRRSNFRLNIRRHLIGVVDIEAREERKAFRSLGTSEFDTNLVDLQRLNRNDLELW